MTHVFVNAFHAHLDVCKQCEQNPFDLCREGLLLLKCAAGELERDKKGPKHDPVQR